LPRRRIETKKLLVVTILFEAVFLVSMLRTLSRLKGLILLIHLTGILLAILGRLFQVLRLELAYNKVNFKNYGNVKSDKVCYYKALQ